MNLISETRGSVSIIVSILVASGVLLGMLAIVVDVGRAYGERRLVQNGAEAAAMAVARQCALDASACTGSAARPTASNLANLNAGADEVTALDEVCGSGSLGACRTLGTHVWECQSATNYRSFARVRTATRESDGATILPPIFARAIGADGVGLWACSQAIWGATSSAQVTFPIALSACDYVSNADAVIRIFEEPTFVPGQGPTCTYRDSLGVEYTLPDMVKGFFYVQLDPNRRECTTPVLVTVGSMLERSTNIVQLCGTNYEAALQTMVGVPTALPIFDQVTVSGLGTAQMRVANFVSFTLKGYRLGGGREFGAPPGGWPLDCRGSNRCIFGTFGQAVVPGGVDPGSPNLGLQSIQLIP